MGDHFEVVVVAAQAIATEMIDLLLARDVTVVMGVDDDVHCDCLAIKTHTSIATTSTIARVGTSPDVARGRMAIDLMPQVLDLAPVDDLVEDGRATIFH